MATKYLERIRSVQPTGPIILFGFCFGGVVAYEIAKQLEKETCGGGGGGGGGDGGVDLLGLLDAQVVLEDFCEDETLRHFLVQQGKITGLLPLIQPSLDAGSISTLSSECLWSFSELLVKKMKLSPEGKEKEYLKLFVEYFRHHVNLQREYLISDFSEFSGEVVFIYSEERKNFDKKKWNELFKREMKIFPTPGSHLSMIYDPHVTVLAKTMTGILESHLSQIKEKI
eukprot:TRINITY_DN15189_c0_g1_i1.p2 TRINITY_DN15189_c0_g1~~TRINITY_DN15189_c0_g1_i1.p2  ORF type:complete len:227 (+),score=78.77 TRINITY_DN15189_c0_g1_i1:984-1664(+)